MIKEHFGNPQELIEALRHDVQLAEESRQSNEAQSHYEIRDLFIEWTEGDSVTNNQFWIKEQLQKQPEELSQDVLNLFAVGILGIARIRVVDLNAQLKELSQQKTFDYPQISEALSHVIQDVETNVYSQFDLNEVPNRTIDGNSINWIAEIAQDSARTFLLLNNPEAAQITLHEAIARLNTTIFAQKASEPVSEKAGDLSALAVLQARLAQLNGSQRLMFEALCRQHKTMAHLQNNDRLKTLSLWAFRHSLNFQSKKFDIARPLNFILGGAIAASYLEPKKMLFSQLSKISRLFKNDTNNNYV